MTTGKAGCPYCTGKEVLTGYNDLQTIRPDLAEEWDYSLNETTPDKIHYNNQTIQAHWICKQCGHKWVHTVKNRDRCPECLRRKTQINVYNTKDLSLYGQFENARSLCEHLGLDYRKNQRSISNACRRVSKAFLGKFILRYPIDDEFSNDAQK
jgi:DNA-directed RNA polymerase subunit RPC12/RpoP